MTRLAINGGAPVRRQMLPYGHQWLDEEDIAAVTAVLRTDWITQGPEVAEFERKVADFCGAKYGVAVSSGTAALHAACAVAGIAPGDEAITSPITFAATANAVVYCGGRPVFADIREGTWNIDPAEVRRHISPRTKAILPVDFAGHPADLAEIVALAREKDLLVIEDAAHALGAEYRGRKIGSLADMTILSFHPVKHITTGEGGMVLTDSPEFYEKLKIFRHHGLVPGDAEAGPWYHEIYQPGYNYRLTDFQCALGISQLKKLAGFIQRRREIAARYNQAFAGLETLRTPVEADQVKAVYHIYVIQLQSARLTTGRREIFQALQAENIGVQVHYPPLHWNPFYQQHFGYRKGDYPRAESYYEGAVTLPLFPAMADGDVDDVIKAVNKVLGYYTRKHSET